VGGGSKATCHRLCVPAAARPNHQWRNPRAPFRCGDLVYLAQEASGVEYGAIELRIEIQLLKIGIYTTVEADDRRSQIGSIETIGGRSLDRRETRLDFLGRGKGGGLRFPQVDCVLIYDDCLGGRDSDDLGILNPSGFDAREDCEPREAGRQCGRDLGIEESSNYGRRLPGTRFTRFNSAHDLARQLGGRLRGWQ